MMKETEIKLFGRKIFLPENDGFVAGGELSGRSSDESSNGNDEGVDSDRCLVVSRGQQGEEKQEQADEREGELNETTAQDEEESQNTNASSDSDHDNPKTPSVNEDIMPSNHSKTLKKPDKIVPCPRCNSMETKFCYYNNYNVSQPRHFCKSCQRYWTNGGTMRNVPVGAGRRKNKNPAPHFHRITISEALSSMKSKPNGTVLSFGSDSTTSVSVASDSNLAEKRSSDGVRKVFKNEDQNVDDWSKEPVMRNMNGFVSPGVQWSFPWNSAFLMPYFSAPIWNCGVPNAWNVPWVSAPPSSTHSSALGKHSRDGELLRPSESDGKESSILIPKTLRIHDPEEAARSSIWATLGIKYDSYSREGIFKALQSKGGEKESTVVNSPLLLANPAALSRSISFRERA